MTSLNNTQRGMKAKTIRGVIRKKINEWLDTIEDASLRKDLESDTIVTGGCIASMLLGEPVNDFDIYFTKKETAERVANYYVARFAPLERHGIACNIKVDASGDRVRVVIKSSGVASEDGAKQDYEYFEARTDDAAAGYVGEIMDDAGEIEEAYQNTEAAALEIVDDGKPAYRPVFMSTNAITLSNKIQIVLRFFGDAEQIHENYDFVHCTNYWTSDNSSLVLRPQALEALLSRELKYVGSKYPLCSVVRLRKFIRRGWTVNAGQILKMAMQISELDLKNHGVLEDQLTGVDAAYFSDIVSRLREKDPDKVNSAYLIEIIDRMF